MIKQNPFSLYDFLGYFIPGSLLVYLVIFFNKLDSDDYQISFDEVFSTNGIKAQSFLFFIIISYAIGHSINYLSSILIEKYANWIYDYPSKYLMKIDKEFSFKTISLKRIGILPVSILDLLFGQLFKFKTLYVKSLDDFLVHSVKVKSLKIINRLIPDDKSKRVSEEIDDFDFFRILHHYAYENTKNHQFKMTNYVVLYGFLRSLTMICVFIFWYLLYLKIIVNNDFISIYYLLGIAVFSYIFFMAFMKFYRRYTLETLMIIAILEDKEG